MSSLFGANHYVNQWWLIWNLRNKCQIENNAQQLSYMAKMNLMCSFSSFNWRGAHLSYWKFTLINILRLRQNSSHFKEDTFKHIFLNKNFGISNDASLKCVPYNLIGDMSSLSHPSLEWLYAFSSFPPRLPPQQLLPLTSKPFELKP